MKTTITLLAILLGFGISFSQVKREIQPVKKRSALSLSERPAERPQMPLSEADSCLARKYTYLGSFTVTGYAILSVKTPGSKELEKITGSVVKVGYTTITGAEIKPMTFGLLDDEIMTRSEFIQHVFGRQVRVQEPDLPNQFLVHKTDHEVCKGFIELDKNHLAIPYQGVLLFVERR